MRKLRYVLSVAFVALMLGATACTTPTGPVADCGTHGPNACE